MYIDVRGEIFGMKKIGLEIVLTSKSFVKGFIDCHVFVGIQPMSILKLIFENYGYGIDLTLFDDK